MASTGKAKAGRSSTGGTEIETAWDTPADEFVCEPGTGAEPVADRKEAQPEGFDPVQTDAETQLYAYRTQMSVSQPPQFPPMAELSSRLNEQPYRDSLLFPPSEAEEAPAQPAALPGEPYRSDLDWFEHRFAELKQLLSRKEEDRRQIADINAKLAGIVARMEALSAGGQTIAAIETKLDALTQTLGETAGRSAADAERISQSAQEILDAADRIQQTPGRFEAAAHRTVAGLGQTVAATASRAAVLAAGHIAEAVQHTGETGGPARLETELRILNRQSREASERTEAALDRVHNTLRDFLERGPMNRTPGAPPPPKKRANLCDPISAPDSVIYMPLGTGPGGRSPQKAQLDTMLVPRPRASDPSLFEALEKAEQQLRAKREAQAQQETAEPDVTAVQNFGTVSFFGEQDSNLPLVAIVAFVLLLVSGALYYLHSRTPAVPLRFSAMPGAAATAPALAWGRPQQSAAVPIKAPAPAAQYGPALFTASDATRSSAASQPDYANEDLNLLESAARHGDRDAQFRIGRRFLNDNSLDGGAAAAARWLARAAAQGHVEAQFMLATLFERGAGVSRDENQAVTLYRKAAAAGHVRAMHNLGVLLSEHASQQDYSEAASWFARAASAGLADSQYNLALLYERGLGLEQDLTRAYYWYQAAANAGDKEATKQAERLKRMLPAGETSAAGEQAGSWTPAIEESSKRADRESGAKG